MRNVHSRLNCPASHSPAFNDPSRHSQGPSSTWAARRSGASYFTTAPSGSVPSGCRSSSAGWQGAAGAVCMQADLPSATATLTIRKRSEQPSPAPARAPLTLTRGRVLPRQVAQRAAQPAGVPIGVVAAAQGPALHTQGAPKACGVQVHMLGMLEQD